MSPRDLNRAVRRARRAAAAAALALAAAACAEPQPAAPAWPPERLSGTGLYADVAAKSVDARNLPYEPQYPLWTDGAAKRRWMRLPEGAAIDASDPDRWEFPVGTRLWKEFAWGERAVETRYMERLADGSWGFATYVWEPDGSDARLAPARGVPAVAVAPGALHDVPGRGDCRACHEGPGRASVLGVSALQLSPDRDPLALHAAAPPEGAADLASLAGAGRLRGLDPAILASPPRVEAPTARSRAARGYLHANCGMCHNPTGPLASLGLDLAVSVRPGARTFDPDALASPSRFRPAGLGEAPLRVRPGAAASSVVLARMGSREPSTQMPPLGTRRADADACALVAAWIDEDLVPGASAVPPGVAAAGRTHGKERKDR